MTASTTYSGITFTWKDDGKLNIKATGVNTSEVYYNLEVDIGSKYVGKILSCVGCNSYVKLYISQTSGSSAVSTQGDDIVIPSTAVNRVFVAVYANAPSFDIDVEPMIRDSIITSNTYSAPALPNSELTILASDDRDALAEEIDAGAKNKLPAQLTSNTTGHKEATWTFMTDCVGATVNGTVGVTWDDAYVFNKELAFNDQEYVLLVQTSNPNLVATIFGNTLDAPENHQYTAGAYRFKGTIPTTSRLSAKSGTYSNATIKLMICTKAAFAVSPKFVPYAKSNYSLTQYTEGCTLDIIAKSSGSLNDITTNTFAVYSGTVTGKPVDDDGNTSAFTGLCRTDVYNSTEAMQTLTRLSNGHTWIRTKSASTWNEWIKLGGLTKGSMEWKSTTAGTYELVKTFNIPAQTHFKLSVNQFYTLSIPTGVMITAGDTTSGIYAKSEQTVSGSSYDTVCLCANIFSYNQGTTDLPLYFYARKHSNQKTRVDWCLELL